MSDVQDPIKLHLRELERAFSGFERGERNRLYESRDSLVGLAEAVEVAGFEALTPLCEMMGRLLGLVLMEGGLDEARSVHLVQEMLGYVEAQVHAQRGSSEAGPGGVFHVVNAEKVGEILLRRGLIAPDQLEKALLLQRVSKGRRVGEVLLAMNAIDQRTLSDVLENQKGETRRAETRGSAVLGSRSIQMNPLPPVPGPSSAPVLPPVAPVQVPFPAAAPYPPQLPLAGDASPMAHPSHGQPNHGEPNHGEPSAGPASSTPQPLDSYPGVAPQRSIPFHPSPAAGSLATPPPNGAVSPLEHPDGSGPMPFPPK